MENLLTLVDSANSVLWNVILIVLLCGTGIYYTIRLKFIQIRKFPEGLNHSSLLQLPLQLKSVPVIWLVLPPL